LKRAASSWDPNVDDSSAQPPPAKKVRFEQRWDVDNGAKTVWGDGFHESDVLPQGFQWFYYCACAEMMIPVPCGYEPIEEVEDPDEDISF
jgi:hypothetical protein